MSQSYLPYPHVSDELEEQDYHHHNSRGDSIAEDPVVPGLTQIMSPQHLMIPAEPGQGWLLSETLERLEKLALAQKRIAEDMLRLVEGVREGVRNE